MALPIKDSRDLRDRLTSSDRISNLFAQAHARQVLQDIGETPENFPGFAADLEVSVTWSAYALLAVGCSLAEQDQRVEAVSSLEQGATLLEQIYRPTLSANIDSNFNVLIAAMAFYAAGQYSRAFVAATKVTSSAPLVAAVVAFLRKDTASLLVQIKEVLLKPRSDKSLEEERDVIDYVAQVALCRALALMLEFTCVGNPEHISAAVRETEDALSVAGSGHSPSWWWIARLMRLMLNDLLRSSPWSVLPSYFSDGQAEELAKYIRLLAFGNRPSVELWESQRAALPAALSRDGRGAVINLRTSSGKTRVAEIAILQTLLAEPTAKVLYLAPFRSLAVEIEQTLSAILGPLGFNVSHLYGGSRVSSVDTTLADEASLIIATPEKAKALLRAKSESLASLKLIVVDEGHLIGAETRYVRNELFLEHLRIIASHTGARLLLLSAVLPNAEELATWIGGTEDALGKSDWKPSGERFGLLRWNGQRVRIQWKGLYESFNPSFVVAGTITNPASGRKCRFPKTKSEAVAAAAVRLSAAGPVMIFIGKARDVPSMAAAVITALGTSPERHRWPAKEWAVFEAVCSEELSPEAVEVAAARLGVICHSASLPPQVRWATERLMRSMPPKVIVATQTLAQGVNVGVSTVIVANVFQGKTKVIGKRDFWNICGRAGRAFVDGEGRVLYAIDETAKPEKLRWAERMAKNYFDGMAGESVESGILYLVAIVRKIANESGVAFSQALELISENDFSAFGEKAKPVEELCDLLDDGLLALQMDPLINQEGKEPTDWVDDLLRHSLAVIQAQHAQDGTTPDEVLEFFKSRVRSAMKRVPESDRHAIVGSGLPLRAAIKVRSSIDLFQELIDAYISSDRTFEALVETVSLLETWSIGEVPSLLQGKAPNPDSLERLRSLWLGAIGAKDICTIDESALDTCRDFYGYSIPWVTHAIAQQFRTKEDVLRADAFDEIALLVEMGVPNELSARIFLAGVRSRVAATELARLSEQGISFAPRLGALTRQLGSVQFCELVYSMLSPQTRCWLELLRTSPDTRWSDIQQRFPAFNINLTAPERTLHVKKLDGQLFLCGTDMRTRVAVESTPQFPFDSIADNAGLAFENEGETWTIAVRDPHLEVIWHDEDEEFDEDDLF